MKIISKNRKKNFTPIGNIIKVDKILHGLSLDFTNGKGKLLVYSSKLIRFIISPKDFDIDYSYAVIKPLEDWDECNFSVEEKKDFISFSTNDLLIEIKKKPYKVTIKDNNNSEIILCEDDDKAFGACYDKKTLSVRSYKKVNDKDHFYGFGEKTGHLDKKGEYLIMHGRDMPYKGNIEPLYQNHPYFIKINKGIAHAIFLDNISKTSFDMGNSDPSEYYFGAEKGDLNFYFILGPSIDEILDIYTKLTGHMELPPKWALGYHQCRYSYKDDKAIKKISSKFRESKIPCDAIWFDIHYMDGYRCFTFDHKRFPDPKRLMKDLKQNGFQPIVIVDPGIKIDQNYKIYQELIENKFYTPKKNGKPSVGLVWPGLTHFPDFTREKVREWWADKHEFYFDLGIEGFWNDMNEPALSINPIKSWIKRLHSHEMYFDDKGRNSHHDDAKNIYAFCENWATWMAFKKFKPNSRPFILTRSGYSGIQRYAAIWTGDNWTNWKSITIAIRMLLNLNLSAQCFVGSDVGGFVGILKIIRRDKKQFIRWIQTGVFYPFCRVHTAIGTKTQDPFSYGKLAQEISKKYIELRYELLPLWYTLFYEANKSGKPIIRPIFYYTPEDEECFKKEYENQFFLGNDILIIPIDKRNINTKIVYFPEDKWINYWTLEELEGNQEHKIPITLNDIPIFIRKGAIIPTQPVIDYIGQRSIDTLILKIFRGEIGTTSSTVVYEDDGTTMDYAKKNIYFLLEIKCEYNEEDINIYLAQKGDYQQPWKNIHYIIFDNGKIVLDKLIEFNKKNINFSLRIK